MLSRSDAHSVLGGDTIQMLNTKTGLEKLGVQVEAGRVQDKPPLNGFDLIHVFNWEQLEQFLSIRAADLGQVPPLVLSPIFWFHTGHWFNEAVSTMLAWKLINRGIGTPRSRILYEQWQQAKFRWGARGRKLGQCLAIPARLLPNSTTEVTHLESVLGLKGKLQGHCTIVPNCVARELYDPPPPPNQAFLKEYGLEGFVFQVGRIQAAKNQLGLIEALFDLPVPLVFVGQPSPYEPDYVQRCYELGQRRGKVFFLGPMSPAELAGLYVLAAVHVLPSWRETPGLVSLEAAAAGCRVVSTAIGSAREYLRDEAWYCDPRDPNSIRGAVLSALNTPPSQKLRDRVLECYTWDIAAKTTLEAYHLALDGNGVE